MTDEGDERDQHHPTIRLRVAALLAYARGRDEIVLHEWSLAGHVVANSFGVRRTLDEFEAQRERETAERTRLNGARIDEVTGADRLIRTTRRLVDTCVRAVESRGPLTTGKLLNALNPRDHHHLASDALVAAIRDDGRLTESTPGKLEPRRT